MIIYRTVSNAGLTQALRQNAEHLAKHIYPESELIQIESQQDRCRMILESGEALVGFEVLGFRIQEEAYEAILRFAADLEAARKKHSNRSVKEIELCLLFAGCSEDLIRRIQKGMIPIQLFDWSSIRSDSEEALLVRQVYPEAKASAEPITAARPDAVLHVHGPTSSHLVQDFNEPERIAFQRFGLELSEKRIEPRRSSLKKDAS